MPRKRFSAFDDFPVEKPDQPEWEPAQDEPAQGQPETAAAPQPKGANSLFVRSKILPSPETHQVERIERLKPSQMIPDRFQPRRLLPTVLRGPFFSGKIDCYQAARQWLQMANNDEGLKEQVDRLLNMGSSFSEHGQIKPITGAWVEVGDGNYVFQIETGERRFWAACLQVIAQNMSQEPLLRVEVITQPTRMRQVLENRHAEPPSAVGQACEVASLILSELNLTPQGYEQDEFDYFRQAISQRMPPGLWDRVTPVMNVSRPRLEQLMNVLKLPSNLLEMADRYRVPERVLREVLKAPRDRWDMLILASLKQGVTADDIAALGSGSGLDKASKPASQPADPIQQAIKSAHRFSKLIQTQDEDIQDAILDEIANDIVTGDQGETMYEIFRSLAERIRIRHQNRSRRR